MTTLKHWLKERKYRKEIYSILRNGDAIIANFHASGLEIASSTQNVFIHGCHFDRKSKKPKLIIKGVK